MCVSQKEREREGGGESEREGEDTGVSTLGFMLAKQALYHLSHTSSSFCSGYFEDSISQIICLGWPRTVILMISAFQVARIIGVSHRCPADIPTLYLSIYQLMGIWINSGFLLL
jgi:hypothetical protein